MINLEQMIPNVLFMWFLTTHIKSPLPLQWEVLIMTRYRELQGRSFFPLSTEKLHQISFCLTS